MISREQMFPTLLEAVPGFRPRWNKFDAEWPDGPDRPLYVALGSLARHLVELLERNEHDALHDAFAVVEQWIVDGDDWVKKAAIVGLLENAQNGNLHRRTQPDQFLPFLLRESKRWWDKLNRFWNEGRPLTDDS
jgi:hypothetical protein